MSTADISANVARPLRRLWTWLNGGRFGEDQRDLRKFAASEERAKKNLVAAIQAYWNVSVGTRKATRLERRRFAKDLAELIVENIAVKGD